MIGQFSQNTEHYCILGKSRVHPVFSSPPSPSLIDLTSSQPRADIHLPLSIDNLYTYNLDHVRATCTVMNWKQNLAGFLSCLAAGSALQLPGILPSPSCMLNNESCPIPRGWDVDWSVINSTAMMSARESPEGFNPKNRWGYVTLDWQAGWKNWLKANPLDSTCEATSAANCAALKASGTLQR